MQSNREIITLQIGDYANHVATHYWNLEWTNSKLNTIDTDSKHNEKESEQDSHYYNSSNLHTTNPYKSSRYVKLKSQSSYSSQQQSTNSSQSGVPTRRDDLHRNINPNICFHSNKQLSSSQSIKNKLNVNKTIYTPRTIIFATQGSEGDITSNVYDSSSNKQTNQHQNNNNNNHTIYTWNNDINIIQQPKTTPIIDKNNNKTKNRSNCTFWSDYLLPKLHDKSLFVLDGIHHYSTPFYSYSTGYDLLNCGTSTSNELSESIDDRIRWFVENCDWFQGFQIFSSAYDSFSGLLPTLINTIHDDYNNKCILLYDCNPSTITKHKINMYGTDYCSNKSSFDTMNKRFKLNSIVSMAQIWNEVSNIIPISVDHWTRTSQQTKNNNNLLTNNKFYNTSIIGSCLHHYTNSVRLINSNIRLIDIINCTVKMNSMKMSMLSSCSSHLDLNMNYQAISSIEKLLISQQPQHIQTIKQMNQPIFPRLSCLGPINDKYFRNKRNKWYRNEIFGEYSCLNGSNLYDTSSKVVQEWKQNKMILAQKQGSSKSDIDLYCDKWKYDTEKQNYHLKLMTKLASKAQSPLKWNLINNTWKLPTTHPFYFDINNQRNNNEEKNNLKEEKQEFEDDEEINDNRNNYSIWSSGWSSSVIGQTYLNECGENVSQIIRDGNSNKIFGDVELDLTQYKEDLLAFADSYAPIEELNDVSDNEADGGDVQDV